MLFALIAGAGTAITPCVLPVLPALLSASAAGGRRRPLGIVIGLSVTFTIAIVALAQLVKGVGLASGAARTLAVVVLIGFGLILLIPELAARVQAPLSRLARFGPRTRGDGFWTGVAVGGALGFVCAPCAGPILAAVTSVSASSGATAQVVAVALSYAVGLSSVLLLYALGGRAVIDRVKRSARGHVVERTLGVVLIATGALMAANVDVRFEETLARSQTLPGFLLDPTKSLESSNAVQNRLASLRPASGFATRQREASTKPVPDTQGVSIPGVKTPPLPDLGAAPDFTNTQRWFNTPGGHPLSLAGLRGRVVLVDFWTYTCINCIRTLPYLKAWDARYRNAGLTIVGVHTPEFPFEHDTGNVKQAIASDGIKYPVVQDNNYGTWTAYGNQYWPAEYLIDAQGRVRYTHFGEGDYSKDEQAIRGLLAERGDKTLSSGLAAPKVHAIHPSRVATPETYVGTGRAMGWVNGPHKGTHDYGSPPSGLGLNQFAYGGIWNEAPEFATALGDSSLNLDFQAQRVYVVLSPPRGHSALVKVELDGKPIPAGAAGSDVHNGVVTVDRQRLYNVVNLSSSGGGYLRLTMQNGIGAYSFTFG
ncbi:MAG TPA: cytochrome c biogenesis protein DipZ [Thermoleophilaceae bacterium]